ncbi:HAD family hydrolase [Serinicoccus sp. LYQ131]|uniref:HAD family hydrolase n=1 Tax=Serinicoccus sp. LYQ131 TaxID=3378797 RepID=UPI003852D18C
MRDLLGARLSDEQADELFSDYLWRYEAGWRAFDDAVPTLRRIREHGLLAAVLTNGDAEQQQRKVEALALSGEIDVLVCSSELPAAKPDPRAFRAALDAGLSAVLLDRDDRHTGVTVPRVRSLTDLRLPVSDD